MAGITLSTQLRALDRSLDVRAHVESPALPLSTEHQRMCAELSSTGLIVVTQCTNPAGDLLPTLAQA